MSQETSIEKFSFPKSWKTVILLCLLLFSSFFIGSLIISFVEPTAIKRWWFWILVVFGHGVFLKMSLTAWLQRNDYIEVFENGLSYCSKNPGRQSFIQWRDIAQIKERFFNQRLSLYSKKGSRIMNIEYQFENFNKLRNIILKNCPHLFDEHATKNLFHRHFQVHTFLLLGLIFWAFLIYLSYSSGQKGPAYIFIAFFILNLYALLIEPHKLLIGSNSLTLHFYFWSKQISFRSIRDISIENMTNRNHNSAEVVVIKRTVGKPIRLNWFSDGALAIYVSLIKASGFEKNKHFNT